MTVNSYIHNQGLPVVFMPVYFGYEKLIEGGSFISELGGAAKQKETLFGLIRSINALREYFGKVYVNIGDPIHLDEMLDAREPQWRDKGPGEERPPWINEVISDLGGFRIGI